MRLVYKRHAVPEKVGTEVKVNDITTTFRGERVMVNYFRPPHKPSSEGHVEVQRFDEHGQLTAGTSLVYVGIIGAEWIEREDR